MIDLNLKRLADWGFKDIHHDNWPARIVVVPAFFKEFHSNHPPAWYEELGPEYGCVAWLYQRLDPDVPHYILNRGFESAVILRFLVDFYGNLPDYVAFIQGRPHNDKFMQWLNCLNFDNAANLSYVPLAKKWLLRSGAGARIEEGEGYSYEACFTAIQSLFGLRNPDAIDNGLISSNVEGNHFLVSKHAILQHDKRAYELAFKYITGHCPGRKPNVSALYTDLKKTTVGHEFCILHPHWESADWAASRSVNRWWPCLFHTTEKECSSVIIKDVQTRSTKPGCKWTREKFYGLGQADAKRRRYFLPTKQQSMRPTSRSKHSACVIEDLSHAIFGRPQLDQPPTRQQLCTWFKAQCPGSPCDKPTHYFPGIEVKPVV
eukprot:TRINITY_DN1760_c0_g1_i1.p1 TRINITY_DN1760_c0_g1~~TRINITY_DN1760_c0_g1_i1.p1  ORF type:complete len:375 (+),score=16.81 TRINITY_DN1760_c0_g1_i1:414-1538(+)